MNTFLTWNYWFTVNPGPASLLKLQIFIGILVLLIIIAIAVSIAKKRGGIYKGLFKKLYNFSSANFIIGLIILFFNYENVPFFSSRMWLGFWFLEMIIWGLYILKDLKRIPQKKKEIEAAKELKKYLP